MLSGCFKLTEYISARDWVDFDGLFALPNESLLNPIIDGIKDIVDISSKNTFIIGINYYGAIFSAIIGYRFDIPFSYCFDERKIVNEFEREIKKFELKSAQRILLVADAMVYGNTICELVNSINFKDDIIIDVLVLLERRIKDDYFSNAYSNFQIRHIYVLNDDFPIEICRKEVSKCIFTLNNKINKYPKQIK